MAYLQDEISKVLGMNASEIDVQQPLNTMGIDSLMSVELRNRLQKDLEVDLPVIKFIEAISIVDFAAELNEQLIYIHEIQISELENKELNFLSDTKNSNWIEGQL